MTVDKPQSGLLPQVSAIGSIVAPVIAALTGTIYLAGWTHRETMLGHFGLSAGHFSESIQATLARGYAPFLVAALALGLLSGFVWILVLRNGLAGGRSGGILDSFVGRFQTFFKWYLYSVFALMILMVGLVSGLIFGAADASRRANLVANGCQQGCFIYVASDRRVVGTLLAQDSTQMAVLTAGSVVMLNVAELRAVTPFDPNRPRPTPARAKAPST